MHHHRNFPSRLFWRSEKKRCFFVSHPLPPTRIRPDVTDLEKKTIADLKKDVSFIFFPATTVADLKEDVP
ncbi:hypothetical protein HanRHA438_Chr17g0818401 [Helianthus annuus]|nr:hypothetical protein HanRHA438_Chr17g0818401 [Helianthus annuus]